MTGSLALPSSFRDPAGFVYERDGNLYRQINLGFQSDLEMLMESGLQRELQSDGLVVGFKEADLSLAATESAAMVIEPERVSMISYPHEWCFSQLKDAALLTLEIVKRSISKGMILKDASAYNVQFIGSRPVFIDTLSFERYEEGTPWIAYLQFCRHFLAPLAVMAHVDIRLGMLLQTNLDGIPLDLASKLLPLKSKLSPGLLAHIYMHAKAQQNSSSSTSKSASVTKTGLLALVDSLQGTISGLRWAPTGTEWSDYYLDTNYSKEAFADKISTVKYFLGMLPDTIESCCDLGANNGEFSHLATEYGLRTVALDIDPAAVEKCYQAARKEGSVSLLALLQDLRNPTPNFGWRGNERDSIVKRNSADVLLALALLHHLVIGNNVPLSMVAEYFASLSEWLIIEFVPKEDSQLQRMLVARKDIFVDYDQGGFEAAFGAEFEIQAAKKIEGSLRSIYLMRRKSS